MIITGDDSADIRFLRHFQSKLMPLDGEPILNATHYHQLVGSLIYLTVTHLNISHAMSMVSKFMDTPCSIHYVVIFRILQYIEGTLYHGFHYSYGRPLPKFF